MKYCPVCGYETQDDNYNFCPCCFRKEPVRLLQKEDNRETGESWTIPLSEHPDYRHISPDNLECMLEPYERLIKSRTYGSICRNCGHVIRPNENQEQCPICGHRYEFEYLIQQTYIPEERDMRLGLTKEDLIIQLKDIAQHDVVAPYKMHRNAMCYSIAPPRAEIEVPLKCEECGKVVMVKESQNMLSLLKDKAASIYHLGYKAAIKGLCRKCAEKTMIDPILLSRYGQDDERYFYLFAFKPNNESNYTFSISNELMDYEFLEAFLRNKTTIEQGEKILRVKDELPVIQMMSGIRLPGIDELDIKNKVRESRRCYHPLFNRKGINPVIPSIEDELAAMAKVSSKKQLFEEMLQSSEKPSPEEMLNCLRDDNSVDETGQTGSPAEDIDKDEKAAITHDGNRSKRFNLFARIIRLVRPKHVN